MPPPVPEYVDLPGAGRSVVGPGTRIRGVIKGEGSLLVHGSVEGEIALGGGLVVAPGAHVDATVEAGTVDLSGDARGSIRAGVRVALAATGRFDGELTTPVLDARPGSIIQGPTRVAGAPLGRTLPAH